MTKILMHKPQEISIAEWKEIMQVPTVKESWGIENDTPEQFADSVYGVKFSYTSGMAPGYAGDLYIIHGDALGEPVVLIRREGRLIAQ